MRPGKLTIQGLTAYKKPVEVDFTGLDLFAITGPTGAGKSSLVDAITFALFGQAPRVGRNVKELISQGEERLRVEFEFSTNGSKYRVHRATARKGAGAVQLERFDAASGEWLPIADRATEATGEIEEILRMDYEAFVRSVLLPQGQFQEFLAGDRDQRRKVLDGLLQLNVYAAMQQAANAIAARRGDEARTIRERLETELRDATPDALKAAKTHLAELQARAKELAALREALDAACRTAEAITDARRREQEARDAAERATKALAEAKELTAGGETALKGLDDQITAVRAEIKAVQYDSGLHLRLTQCVPLLQAVDRLAAREQKITNDIKEATAAVARDAAQIKQAQQRHEAARHAAEHAQAVLEEARQGNAAALLQSRLKPGDPCPVCGQKVGVIEAVHEVAQLDKLRTAAEAAQKAERSANAAVGAAETDLARTQQTLQGLETQLKDAQSERGQRAAELDAALPEPGLALAEVERRIEGLESAKSRLEALAGDEKVLLGRREAEAAAIAGAQKDVARLEAEQKTHAAAAEAAAGQAKEAATGLAGAVRKMGWEDVAAALDRGQDPAPVLQQRARTAQADETTTNQEIGAQGKHIEQIEADIEKAEKLREQEEEAREAATLARDLASLLRTDSFPAFIRERALLTLARAGSERLEQVSGGRYDLAVDGQDFLIVDRWNGGETRSVKTLSGGETFLASLALALALAEHLPALASTGAESSLESLFIDEGFSHLDSDTLDIVASALEVLGQDRSRLIGVITHVPALAERMPARVTVHKEQTGSTVTVE